MRDKHFGCVSPVEKDEIAYQNIDKLCQGDLKDMDHRGKQKDKKQRTKWVAISRAGEILDKHNKKSMYYSLLGARPRKQIV